MSRVAALPYPPRRSTAPGRKSRRWQLLLRLLLPLGMLLFVVLLLNAVEGLDWGEVRQSLLRFERPQLVAALLFTALAYTAAGSYELLSRRHEKLALPAPHCLAIGFIAYSIAANVSSLLGNAGARYRLYAQQGIGFRQATRIAVFSVSSNWSGFVLLAGLAFTFVPPELPAHWSLPEPLLRAAGLTLLALALGYVFACHRWARRGWQWRSIRYQLPTLPLALGQLALSLVVWRGIAAVIHNFLPAKATLVMVLPVLLLSTVAGLFIRLPAGVGVTEVVFVTLLGPTLGTSAVIAALLAYRAVFQLLPVLLAALLYLLLELKGRRTLTTAGSRAAGTESA